MPTLNRIRDIITQIINDPDVRKPDIFCSEYIFLGLTKRDDCQLHPTQSNTIVMRPNVYWAVDPLLSDVPNVVVNTRKGELLMKYLGLVDFFILVEKGSYVDIQNTIKEIFHQQR